MNLDDLQITGTGRRSGVRQLRKLLGPGKTTDERGSTYMAFAAGDDEFDRVASALEKQLGEPRAIYPNQLSHPEVKYLRFGDKFTLKKMRIAGQPSNVLQFSYMS